MGATSGFASQGVTSLFEGFAQSEVAKGQGALDAATFEANASFAEMRAEDAIRRGSSKAGAVRGRGRRLVGEQRANFAAQGIDVDSGTARVVQEDTALVSELDALEVENNAWLEAFGFHTQAAFGRSSADFARKSARFSAEQSLLTGGLQSIGSFGQAAASFKESKNKESKKRKGES